MDDVVATAGKRLAMDVQRTGNQDCHRDEAASSVSVLEEQLAH